MTKILFIDNGIEFDSILLKKKPFGGAELAFVSLVEALARLDYEVCVYNNCKNQGKINGVNWKKLDNNINNEKFDVLVINRGDKYLNFKTECKRRIFWIHNPAKYLLKFRYLSKLFFNKTKIVFSSLYHSRTYPFWAPASERIVIPYGVSKVKVLPKKNPPPPIAIFTSNPMRDLDWLLDQWEKNIFPKVKNSKFNIFSGIETYGNFGLKHKKKIESILKKAGNLKNKGVRVKPPVRKKDLFTNLRKSRILIYKGTNDETFCMAVAEAQIHGIPVVVCNYGSLNERVKNNETGFVCKNDKEFFNKTIKLLKDDNTWMRMHNNLIGDNNHLDWLTVAKKWKQVID